MGKCWVYFVVVFDLFVRKLVGWVMLFLLDSRFIMKVLEMVWEICGKFVGVMF